MGFNLAMRQLAVGAVVVAGALSVGTPAMAQAAAGGGIPAPIIAVVDVEQIMQETAAAKSVRAQAGKYEQNFQSEIAKEESALRATQQELEQQRKTLPPDAFADKARAFEASFGAFQRKNAARQRAFGTSMNTAMGKVQQAMLNATQTVAVAHGATVVLPRAQVMLFDDKMNITRDIIAEMDKSLTSVEFPPPRLEAADQGAAPATAGGSKKKSK